MSEHFSFDVLLSHSSKDKVTVRALAERLAAERLRVWFDDWQIKPGDSIPAKIEEGLEQSRVVVLCMSANAFGSDWAQLEAGTFRFRDPLNKERRFIPLRLDDAPIKGSLAQFLHINWLPANQEFQKLVDACQPPTNRAAAETDAPALPAQLAETVFQLQSRAPIRGYLFGSRPKQVFTGESVNTMKEWDLETGKELRTIVLSMREERVAARTPPGLDLRGFDDGTLRLTDKKEGRYIRVLEGHTGPVKSVDWEIGRRLALSGSEDKTIRLWDMEAGRCLNEFHGHARTVNSVAWSPDCRHALSGSDDKNVRLWNIELGQCVRVLKGHQSSVKSVAWSSDGRRGFTGDQNGCICVWNLSEFATEIRSPTSPVRALPFLPAQVQYTNAKVLLVGESGVGKTGLSMRLALNDWQPSDSTVGVWATQWKLPVPLHNRVEREIWFWDFGGQADQRMVHQLYMDRTALILLLFNADQEDVLPGLRDWLTALRRCVSKSIPQILVAGRVDTGFKASRGKLLAFAKEQGLAYHETSAKSSEGCDSLREAIIAAIRWDEMEQRTSPHIFKLIKDAILKLRDEGQVLHTFKELRDLLWRRMADEGRFTDETLQTVIGLLDGPGVVRELEYGTYILLAPEWINVYAQAVIRTLRSTDNDLGVLPLRSIAEGKLMYQSIGRDGTAVEMKRLQPVDERVVLGEMERQLMDRGLCLRQGDKLVFPSHCGRDRPTVLEHPSVFVSYAVEGFLDNIYATLVVKLADSQSFQLKELWRDAADFATLAEDHHMGLKLTRETASKGVISVYFGKGVAQEEQVIFANYIHAHLEGCCEEALRLRHYVCPKCHTPKGNPQVLMKKLLALKQDAETECDYCEARFPLWDALERKFASEAVRKQVEQLRTEGVVQLDSRRKGKLLVLDVGARITSANQKWHEIPNEEDDGIDIVVEFTDDDGNGVGKGLCLQLKSGNSHLRKRKTDGIEVFAIKKPRWVMTWMNQPYPVMLVVGTFSEEDERAVGKEKLEFADVRWMEITSVLRRLSEGGTKPVQQIEFKGERLDLTSVRRWRNRVLGGDSQ